MKKKIILFYTKKDIIDMRVNQLESAARKNNLLIEKICIQDLFFTDAGIIYNNNKLIFNKTNLHWIIGFPPIARDISFLLKLEQITLFPLIHDIAYDLDDKYLAHCFFAKHNIPTLHTTLLEPHTIQQSIQFLNNFPLIIKTTLGSIGTGVEIVNSIDDINNFIKQQQIPSELTYMKKLTFILQEYIEENNGSDYRVLCIGQEVLGIIKRTAKNGFKSNVSLGGSVQHIKSHVKMEDMARNIMKKSGLFMAGIDFIQTDRGFLAIEINTSPQFEGFEKATNINVAEKIIENLL